MQQKEKKTKQRLLFVDLIDLYVLHFVQSFEIDKRLPPSAHLQEKRGQYFHHCSSLDETAAESFF